ncbi:MAG: acylphosphatase [Nitrospinota bacterium]|nr:acylphosphatase [Nitrospinota bacterium]
MPEKRFRAIVSGKVQGVCFRASAEDEACLLGLRGRVRNMSDGSVEVIAEGEEEKLARLLKWLHHGPAGAAVREVKTIREEPTGEYDDFKIAY